MKKLTLLLLLIANFCLAQNPYRNADGGLFGASTNSLVASAILEARSTTKGVLFPGVTTTQMNAIPSPAGGLFVRNTSDSNKPYYFTGTTWNELADISDLASYQPLDSDLTAIAALSPPNDNFLQRKGGVWVSRTIAQVKTDLSINNVDNTADTSKPVSTAQQTALDLKEDLSNKSNDGTLASDSAIDYTTVHSVKTAVETARNTPNAAGNGTEIIDGAITHGDLTASSVQASGDIRADSNLRADGDAIILGNISAANFPQDLSGYATLGNIVYNHTIFTPTTGGTVTLVNNQYNIINPTGALLALTVTLPASPSNNDVVQIKYTQSVSTVTYSGGTVVGGLTSATGGTAVTTLVYDSGTNKWY